ncbi:sensor domain-containing protein [Kitasatospora sp. NPDC056138]|uniref:sensor domain-containing protein n=1 Tax=Kitasatospora sp. NPDC056138 TaxID=3345724 RepID=UPI0035DD2922
MSTDDTRGPAMSSTTTSTDGTGPYGRDTHAGRSAAGPGPSRWAAPVSAATWRQFGFAMSSLPLAVAGFAFVVVFFSAGLGLALTALGLPLTALMLTGARGFGALERHRARTLLGAELSGPAPVRPRRPGFWGGCTARLADPAGWKAALYQVVMLPWSIVSFVLSTVFLTIGWALTLYPTYHWVYHRYLGWPGMRVVDFSTGTSHHQYYISSPWQIAGVSVLGIAFLYLAALLVRAVNGVTRAAVRGLLSAR